MKKVLLSILIFCLVWVFVSLVYIQLVPIVGGLTPEFYMLAFLAGEMAVCTYLIIKK